MVNAQEWLQNNYPDKETVTKIKRGHFSEILEGELIIENFPNLQEIDVSSFRKGKLTKLKIFNCPQLRKLNCENNQLEELDIDGVSKKQLQKVKRDKTNAQEWLDKEYPKKQRSEVTEIYLTEPSLEGELDLGSFGRVYLSTYLKLYIYPQVDETKIVFKNLPEKIMIIPINAQRYINYHYPSKQIRYKAEKLDINYRRLEGNLDLSDFANLRELDFRGNKLTSLNVNNCLHLEKIECYNNQLTNLDVNNCSYLTRLSCNDNSLTNITLPTEPTNLEYLDLSNNNFPAQDLSFLVPYANLKELYLGNYDRDEIKQNIYNHWTGSLDYLSGMKKLWELDISNTDLNEVNIDKLPQSLRRIDFSIEKRLSCKLVEIISQLKIHGHGKCQKCQQWNTSQSWCQPCADKEWKKIEGQELVEKFIQQQPGIEWIPYEEFTNIEYLAEGGFSKIYTANWGVDERLDNRIVVLKSLNNSQNIGWDFLQEIINTKVVKSSGVVCYGLSQDPATKNYLIINKYMEGGNLRQYLQSENDKLSLENKFRRLWFIAMGLNKIHQQNLIHRDFHSGNILNNQRSSYITDLGLSRLVSSQNREGQIFGVLPYVAPETLQGEVYTQKSDIYSFGIIAYELFANSYPYPDLNELDLQLKVCQGYRPNMDKLKVPQLLKSLIARCWSANPEQRPNAEELERIINNWREGVCGYAGETQFSQQYQEIEKEYNTFSQTTPYQIHPTAITTSRLINTKEITQKLQQKKIEEYHTGTTEELSLDKFDELTIQKAQTEEQTSTQTQIPPK
ncbi:putative Non-specific protein-tyrosine kinase [endosymbiont DhMRE of Dentiscutata heterogama]|uniref:leucine-rich repeat-containing protein kinase family protein n=1 Tax=endosymbiont DhMRE of Dentiscutata heterogama TaxID=1609546 RepID=UPI000629D751|nr:protein kinase [endosymbiont DhMRE of Dentiscutata heterogama]CFW93055.1 putative Non-specific protein-tyrosine kinase [endosymbiont DhMRE of Dentiscutata heterogama]